MAEPRRIVLADPLARPGEVTRLAVAGQGAPGAPGDVKMYEWDGHSETMSMVGLQTDVGGGIKALAWSPHPAQRHLLSIGLSTGRVHLISLSPASLTFPLRGTPNPSSVLSVKHSRAVTSLAFSTRDPHLLASGYERHRSDHSLLIWDVADAIASLPQDPDGDHTYTRGTERLEVTNPYPPREQVRHVQQYCAAEAVHSVAWAHGSAHELFASANNKVLRMYDLRAAARDTSTTAAAQWATRAVQLLTPNPVDAHRLASVEPSPQGGVVRLWDTRKHGHEVTSLDVTEGGNVVSLEWAGAHQLGVATRDGGMNIWDIVNGPKKDDGTDEWVTVAGMRHVLTPKQQLHSFVFVPQTTPAKREVVFLVKDGTIGVGPLWNAPVIASSSMGELAVSGTDINILDPEVPPRPRVESHPSASPPRSRAHSRAPSRAHSRQVSRTGSPTRRNSADERRKNRFQLGPDRVTALLAEEHLRARSRSASPNYLRASRRDLRSLLDEPDEDPEEFDYGDEVVDSEGFRHVLRHDVAYVMRRRAEESYGLNSLQLNAAVATKFPGADRIAGIWEFINHFVQATTPECSQYNGYDLTYQGLWPIWTGLLGAEGRDTSAPPSAALYTLRTHAVPLPVSRDGSGSGASTPRRGTVDAHDAEYSSVIQSINAMRADAQAIAAPGSHRLPHTDKAPQRRMMLAVCGENHAYDTMEEVHRLVDDNQRTKAACWAFFAGEEGPAITILMRSDDEKHRLMGATIAGFMTQSRAERGSLFWQEHWRSMVDKVDDPYIRAVLARIAGENWESILYDESLPLLDRVAVAVCNLSDKELTTFLRNRLTRCVNMGSLPGLALTGFTPPGLQLLQRFVDRTGDIQTAALLSAFFPRAHLTSAEIATLDRWVDSYRTLLDSWLNWVNRTSFDVEVLAQRRLLGDSVADAVQTVVVCPVCNNQLTKQTEEMLTRKNALRGTMRLPTTRTVSCMYCQNALPRCSVCLVHVRPSTEQGVAADTMEQAYVSCQTCRHGGHADHILKWFMGGLDSEPSHEVCPVAGCDCRCASL